MIAFTIEAAIRSECFDSVVVSTDDDEIAAMSLSLGAAVPFRRSASLADDFTPVSGVVTDALRRVDPGGCKYSSVAQMMPNCPFRSFVDVRASLVKFENSGAQYQISVTPFGWTNPWWALKADVDGVLRPLFPDALQRRSQDLPALFSPSGAMWWARPKALLASGTFHAAGCKHHRLSWMSGFDIDTEEDLAIAQALVTLTDGGR